MSGGSMEYVFSRIQDAADMVSDFRKEIAAAPLSHFEFSAKRINMSAEQLKAKVLQYFDVGWRKLLEAAVYARRIEWLTSYDDDYDSFIERTDEELAEIVKSLKSSSEAGQATETNEEEK